MFQKYLLQSRETPARKVEKKIKLNKYTQIHKYIHGQSLQNVELKVNILSDHQNALNRKVGHIQTKSYLEKKKKSGEKGKLDK